MVDQSIKKEIGIINLYFKIFLSYSLLLELNENSMEINLFPFVEN